MIFRRLFAMAALAGSLMLATSSAQAAFTYTSTPGPTPVVFGGSTVTFTGVTKTGQSAPTFINIADVADNTITPDPSPNTTPTDTTTINLSIPILFTNTAPSPGVGASGTITLTGQLQFVRSDSGGEVSFLNSPAFTNNGANIGGVVYTLSNVSYSAPTVNSATGDGNITVLVSTTIPSGIPEPSSVILLGSGLAGLVGFRLRRNKKA
jgi:hypothetical protein